MDKKLVYIKPVCKNSDGTYRYDFYFSETPENVWGQDWDISNPLSCDDTEPEKTTYSEIKHIDSPYKLKTAEEMSCLSMENAIYGIIALGWIDIETLEEYPEHGRMVFHFNDSMDKVTELLSAYDIELQD